MPVSFCANLKIDENFGKKVPRFIDADSLNVSLENYKNFLDIPAVKKLTEGDTIVLSTQTSGSSYCVNIDHYEKGKNEPFSYPVCISKGTSGKFGPNDFIFSTSYFIATKSGEKPKFSDTCFSYMKRGIRAYINKLLQENNF